MFRFHLAVVSTVCVLAVASSAPTAGASVGLRETVGTDDYERHAFTLEEMNCFSSDIRALEPAETNRPANDEMIDTRVAASSGTNGIPCNPRDPKAAPKKKRSRS